LTTLVDGTAFDRTPMSTSSYTGSFGSIYVPMTLLNQYRSASKWSAYADRITTNEWGFVESEDIVSLYETTHNISIDWYAPANDPDAALSNVSVISSDDTIAIIDSISTSNESITFNVTSLTKEGVATITVTGMIGENETSSTFDITVWEVMPGPQSTFTVESVTGASHGFALNANGYYESQNKGKDNTAALCKVVINASGDDNLYLDCINYAESRYDYGILSTLDKPLSTSSTADSSNVFKSFNNLQSPDVQTVDYGVIPAGEHSIYVKYIKDTSQASGNDSLQFKVRFELVE
jgi:hypothetical protein